MIGIYDYTVILTYLGFSCGMLGIFLSITHHPFPAILCLMMAGLCDMFDGKVARTKEKRTKEEKNFGIQLDSLSDLVCFGVLPVLIAYSINIKTPFMIPIMLFYPLSALIRLAYFNTLEITRKGDGPVKEYTGLPVTSSALIFPFIYIFRKVLGKYFILIYGILLVVVGILFISNIKIKKPSIKMMFLFILIGVIEVILILAFRMIR